MKRIYLWGLLLLTIILIISSQTKEGFYGCQSCDFCSPLAHPQVDTSAVIAPTQLESHQVGPIRPNPREADRLNHEHFQDKMSYTVEQEEESKGNTYYKDPQEMTRQQLHKFRKYADFSKMTLQDYKNWLNLYRPDPEDLPIKHLRNLQKMLRGQALVAEDIPYTVSPPPMNAQEYFQKLYQDTSRYQPQAMDTQTSIPANYDQYNTFEVPKQLKHLQLGPAQIIEKDCPKVLDYVRPKISRGYQPSTS